MTSPVKTERIVLAKWWGAYRSVPALAFLPALGAVVIAAAGAINLYGGTRTGQPPLSLTWIDRMAFMCFPTAMLLAQGAVVVSVGLALATWIARLGRAVAVSVASYAFVAFGWLLVVEMEIVDELPRAGLVCLIGTTTMPDFFSICSPAISARSAGRSSLTDRRTGCRRRTGTPFILVT